MLLASPFLGGVPDCADKDAVAEHAVKNGVRSSANDKFPNAGFHANTAQMRVRPEGFDDRDDAGCETLGGFRFVQSDEGINFAQTRQSQRRPDYLYRHSDSSS